MRTAAAAWRISYAAPARVNKALDLIRRGLAEEVYGSSKPFRAGDKPSHLDQFASQFLKKPFFGIRL